MHLINWQLSVAETHTACHKYINSPTDVAEKDKYIQLFEGLNFKYFIFGNLRPRIH